MRGTDSTIYSIYNIFKHKLFYEMWKRRFDRCWFDHYYELRNHGILYFYAISKYSDRESRFFKLSISFDVCEYEYYYDLVRIFKSHEDWLFEISEYNYNMDTFDIIFKKPIYDDGTEKEFYCISSNGIDKGYDIDYSIAACYIDNDVKALNSIYGPLNVNPDFDLASHLGGCNPLNDITIKDIRDQLQLPPITPVPTLSKSPIFNPPATICYWTDGTKTVVKCQDEDTYSPEAGLALCYMKKVLGNTSRDLNKELHKYIPEEKGEE